MDLNVSVSAGQGHICVVIGGPCAIGVDYDRAFAFDHKFRDTCKAVSPHFFVQGCYCDFDYVTHLEAP
jgi:hypothetical protein